MDMSVLPSLPFVELIFHPAELIRKTEEKAHRRVIY